MKHIKNIFKIFLVSVLILSCTDDDKVLPTFQDYENGAYLREISLTSDKFNLLDLASSSFEVELELVTVDAVQSVNVYASYAGTNNVAEILVGTMDPAGFSPSQTFSMSALDLFAALGVATEDLLPSDAVTARFEVELTDGRTFSNSNSSANIGGGSYKSPFAYSIEFSCPLLDASLFDGDYEVVIDEWADYGAGDIIPVVFVSEFTFRILATENPFISNAATAYMEITINEAAEIVDVTYNEIFDFGVPIIPTDGGGGTVSSCLGNISVNIKWLRPSDSASYGTYNFTLKKL